MARFVSWPQAKESDVRIKVTQSEFRGRGSKHFNLRPMMGEVRVTL